MADYTAYNVYGTIPARPAVDDFPAEPSTEYVIAYCGPRRDNALRIAQEEQQRHPDFHIWILASARGIRDILNTEGEKIGEQE